MFSLDTLDASDLRGDSATPKLPYDTFASATRGVRVAQADDFLCHRHFLLLHDASFADVGGLFQSCQIIGDEAQDFLAHQTPTRWQIDAALPGSSEPTPDRAADVCAVYARAAVTENT